MTGRKSTCPRMGRVGRSHRNAGGVDFFLMMLVGWVKRGRRHRRRVGVISRIDVAAGGLIGQTVR